MSSLVILAASVFETSCEKHTDKQTPVKTPIAYPRLTSALVLGV